MSSSSDFVQIFRGIKLLRFGSWTEGYPLLSSAQLPSSFQVKIFASAKVPYFPAPGLHLPYSRDPHISRTRLRAPLVCDGPLG
jgi:hypothetical protein